MPVASGPVDRLGDILTRVTGADGVGVRIDGNHAFSGVTPDADDFRRIVRALNGTASGRVFGRVCAERGVDHRLAKPHHPWTNGQAERMVRTIEEATVRAFHYASIDDLRRHVRDWLLACGYAKQLKALRYGTPLEALEAISVEKPGLFTRPPSHDTPGLNT